MVVGADRRDLGVVTGELVFDCLPVFYRRHIIRYQKSRLYIIKSQVENEINTFRSGDSGNYHKQPLLISGNNTANVVTMAILPCAMLYWL